MIYDMDNIKTHLSFDQMPIDDIYHARKGGCFLTCCYGFVLAIILIMIGSVIGIGAILFIQHNYKINDSSLHLSDNDYVIEPKLKPLISIKNYKLKINPIFNETNNQIDTFHYYGSIKITFTPNVPDMKSIALDAMDNLKIFENNLFVYKSRTLSKFDFLTKELVKKAKIEALSDGDDDDDNIDKVNGQENVSLLNSDSRELISNSTENQTISIIETLSNEETQYSNRKLLSQMEQHKHEEVTELFVVGIDHDQNLGILCIDLGTKLKIGHIYIVVINFQSKIKLIQQKSRTGETNKYLITSLTKLNQMSEWFPCLNNAYDKINIDFSIFRQGNMVTLSQSNNINTEIVNTNLNLDIFETIKSIRSNDFAFAILEDEGHVVNYHDRVFITIYNTDGIENIGNHISLFMKIINNFEEQTGIANITCKLSVIIMPNNDDQYFYQRKKTMIFISENIFQLPNEVIMAKFGQIIRSVLFEEILYTNDENDLIWIKEVFPTFDNNKFISEEIQMENHFVALANDIYLEETLQSNFVRNIILLDQPAEYWNIVQSKGISVLNTLRLFMGPSKFDIAFKNYCLLKSQKSPISFIEHLENVPEEQSTIDIDYIKLISSLTSSKSYPILSVTRNLGHVEITQESSNFPNYLWILAFSLSFPQIENSTLINETIWLSEKSITLPMEEHLNKTTEEENTYVLINPSGYGYYRVNYDEQNWLALFNQIQEFPVYIRTILADDAMSLAQYGYLNYSIVFQLINTWAKNVVSNEYLSWSRIFVYLEYVFNNAIGLEGFNEIKKFLLPIIENIYNITLTDEDGNQNQLQKYQLLLTEWACIRLNANDCITESIAKLREIINDKDELKKLEDQEVYVLFGTIILHGSQRDRDMIYAYFNDKDFEHKKSLIKAIGCSSDTSSMQFLINILKNPKYCQYFQSVLSIGASNRIFRIIIMEYLYENLDYFMDNDYKFGARTGIIILNSLFRSISSELELKMFQEMVHKYPKYFTKRQDKIMLKQIFSAINRTMAWRQRFSIEVKLIDFDKL